ncbi:MAG TPA: nuclease-related domain-containing protein [Pirellulales bacterium]|nr:nuclease-related domain-containing protein [Pirellulales bacterium]
MSRSLLRPPGYSLGKKIEDLNLEIEVGLLSVVMIPLVTFAAHISQSYFVGQRESPMRVLTSISLGFILLGIAGRHLLTLLSQRKRFALGLEGELATGEELNQLMLDGCRVFHDIPTPYGNIDHVVISQSGLFSVNSKLLGKPKGRETKAEAVVDQQAGVVRFPDREYRIPVEKLKSDADWLAKHLSSAVGEPVAAEPILALPGWFVKERIGRGQVCVINPRSPKKFFVHNRVVFSPQQVQQLAHQLEQVCRDVDSPHRPKRKRWEEP